MPSLKGSLETEQREKGGNPLMADRKQFFGNIVANPDLRKALDESREKKVTEEELQAQRISFAFGNAPADADITKESVLEASKHISLLV